MLRLRTFSYAATNIRINPCHCTHSQMHVYGYTCVCVCRDMHAHIIGIAHYSASSFINSSNEVCTFFFYILNPHKPFKVDQEDDITTMRQNKTLTMKEKEWERDGKRKSKEDNTHTKTKLNLFKSTKSDQKRL